MGMSNAEFERRFGITPEQRKASREERKARIKETERRNRIKAAYAQSGSELSYEEFERQAIISGKYDKKPRTRKPSAQSTQAAIKTEYRLIAAGVGARQERELMAVLEGTDVSIEDILGGYDAL